MRCPCAVRDVILNANRSIAYFSTTYGGLFALDTATGAHLFHVNVSSPVWDVPGAPWALPSPPDHGTAHPVVPSVGAVMSSDPAHQDILSVARQTYYGQDRTDGTGADSLAWSFGLYGVDAYTGKVIWSATDGLPAADGGGSGGGGGGGGGGGDGVEKLEPFDGKGFSIHGGMTVVYTPEPDGSGYLYVPLYRHGGGADDGVGGGWGHPMVIVFNTRTGALVWMSPFKHGMPMTPGRLIRSGTAAGEIVNHGPGQWGIYVFFITQVCV
jgi:hypothetical protein